MKKIWEFIDNTLKEFNNKDGQLKNFARSSVSGLFAAVIIGLMLRTEHLGVTSIIRTLGLVPDTYMALLNFFHASSWSVNRIRNTWIKILMDTNQAYLLDGRLVMIGDHVKVSKEGKHMTGVKKLHQESATSSKGSTIMGQMYGGLGILMGNATKLFCVPFSITIQDGIDPILEWMDSTYKDMSSIDHLVTQACENAKTFNQPVLLLMDRAFMTVNALRIITSVKTTIDVTLITLCKINYVAYLPPVWKGKGRKPLKGEKVTLRELFETEASAFQTITVSWYRGAKKDISFLCKDLLWGEGLYLPLRFVWVLLPDGGQTILCCTNLLIDPVKIIEAYCLRFKIETFFRAFKQVIGGFSCHFWTLSMPKVDWFGKAKSVAENLSKITDIHDRTKIISCYKATEAFVMCACIATGLLQLCSLKFKDEINKDLRWLRTYSNVYSSEETTQEFLGRSFEYILKHMPQLALCKIINAKRNKFFELEENIS
jgi:hypothetical protein